MMPPPALVSTGGQVLVVDDEDRNRELLRDLLEAHGFSVDEVADGQAALDRVAARPPHVILLDIMMPGLDGFEVCRRLKADARSAAIPVLLVTALNERDERLLGIDVGATDFLSKPVDTRDLLLRTRNAVQMKRLYDQVQTDLRRQQDLERQRDELMHMIIHDMRSPLQGMLSSLEVLQLISGPSLTREAHGFLENAVGATQVLTDLVGSVLDVNRMESGQMPLHRESVNLSEVASESARSLGGLLHGRSFGVEVPPAVGTPNSDAAHNRRVLTNLIGNAVRYSPPATPIRVVAVREPAGVRVEVVDQGVGIDAAQQARIFEKFAQVDRGRKGHSSGIGLTFCKLAVEAHGGSLGVRSTPGQGSTFWFTLPDGPAAAGGPRMPATG